MRLKLLGRSGLRVSEMALGTMTFGTDWGWGSDKEESRRVFDAYVEAGGNLIDTANRYTLGTSERYVGEFIKDDRDRFCVATKFSRVDGGRPASPGFPPAPRRTVREDFPHTALRPRSRSHYRLGYRTDPWPIMQTRPSSLYMYSSL